MTTTLEIKMEEKAVLSTILEEGGCLGKSPPDNNMKYNFPLYSIPSIQNKLASDEVCCVKPP